MAGIATGIYKKLLLKRQTALGVKATPEAGTARSMRRVTSTLDLTKATFESAEVNESQQTTDSRHGVRSVGGTLSGELSVGTYQVPLESILRKNVGAAVAPAAMSNVTAASTGTRFGTYTRAAGSFLDDGFKIGDIINCTGWAGAAVANNNKYVLITALNATVMSVMTLDATPIVARASGDSVSLFQVGKKTWVPGSGHTRDYYTVEHWFGDIGESEQFTDVVFTGATITLPPTGMATIELPMMGLDMQTSQAAYFLAPASASVGSNLASANGVLLINGIPAGLVTGMTIVIAGNNAYPAGDGIVGSNSRPDVLPGKVGVSGQLTVLFTNGYFRDLFLSEAEASIAMVMTADNSASPQFSAFVMSRIKFNGASKDDTQTGMTQTLPYIALENVKTGGTALANIRTTISIQDSSFI